MDQIVEGQSQMVKRQVAPPVPRVRLGDEGLELGLSLLGPACQGQERAIKGKAVAVALLQARQDPVGQEIGRQTGELGPRVGLGQPRMGSCSSACWSGGSARICWRQARNRARRQPTVP